MRYDMVIINGKEVCGSDKFNILPKYFFGRTE